MLWRYGLLAAVATSLTEHATAARAPRAEPGFTFQMDTKALFDYIDNEWTTSGIPALMEFIKVPSLSPGYDPDWATNGNLKKALDLMKAWAEKQAVPGLKATIYDQLKNDITNATAPPLLIVDIPATGGNKDTSFLYGHADKQPLMEDKWTKTKPLEPLIDGNYLYGRGSADDGYALYASVIAVKALDAQKLAHPRVVIFIEAEEESGSENLMMYLNFIKNDLKVTPTFMGIFDSGGLSDNSVFWEVTSMRGVVPGNLRIDIIDKGVHSGNAGGIVPSPWRILEELYVAVGVAYTAACWLVTRVEDPKTGEVIAAPLVQEVTQRRKNEAYKLAEAQGKGVYEGFGWVEGAGPKYEGTEPTTQDIADMIIRLTQTSQMTILGISHDTLPDVGKGGNVIQPYISVDLSFRTAPGTDEKKASVELKALLEANPPYGAKVTFTPGETAPNFLAPVPKPWLDFAMDLGAEAFYGRPRLAAGRGGTVPMMSYFSEVYQGLDFDILATGVLVPDTGHHGPDERLEIDTVKKITGMMSVFLAGQAGKDTFVAPPPEPEAAATAEAPPTTNTEADATATAAASTAEATTAPEASSSSGMSMGVAIGLAVGALVVGAAIGAVVMRVVGKKRSASESTTNLY